ncbi:MAG: hypothetical protein HY536_00625 [Candidatus Colwellbacteria bacterium]|nr:hypothetical protein [Candidatus Colwellbacteria bacterium]
MSQPSPPPAIGVRTMRSDELSLKASGGLGVAPQVFAPADFESEPIFKPDEGEKPRPGAPEQRLINKKPILVSLGMLATIAAAAIAAYAFLGRGGA